MPVRIFQLSCGCRGDYLLQVSSVNSNSWINAVWVCRFDLKCDALNSLVLAGARILTIIPGGG